MSDSSAGVAPCAEHAGFQHGDTEVERPPLEPEDEIPEASTSQSSGQPWRHDGSDLPAEMVSSPFVPLMLYLQRTYRVVSRCSARSRLIAMQPLLRLTLTLGSISVACSPTGQPSLQWRRALD